MNRILPPVLMALSVLAAGLEAQSAGTAGGFGTLLRGSRGAEPEKVSFEPQFSYAFEEKRGKEIYTWLVLSDKEPPLASLQSAKDRQEARRAWCEKEKASFVAVLLRPDGLVERYFQCPANGEESSEKVKTTLGVDSVVVSYSEKNSKHFTGNLRSGKGACPASQALGGMDYCELTGYYFFDAPMIP